jgi:DNA repair exonuclease SbcCD ATPase subunit
VTDTQPQDDLHRERASVQRLQQHLALSLAREQQAQAALDRQRARADHAEGEAERLRGLLRRLEWAGTQAWYADEEEAACPACGNTEAEGHNQRPYAAAGCWLAAELEPGR